VCAEMSATKILFVSYLQIMLEVSQRALCYFIDLALDMRQPVAGVD